MNNLERREQLRNALLRSRADAGVSQEKLAKYIGVTKKTISNWESGKGCPDYYQLLDWFHYIDKSLDDYLKDKTITLDVDSDCFRLEKTFKYKREYSPALLDRLLSYCRLFGGHMNENNKT